MKSDFLVIGAGVAGLRAAIELAEAGEVLVLAKDRLQESSSAYAQGGIAAALSDDDDIQLHVYTLGAATCGAAGGVASRNSFGTSNIFGSSLTPGVTCFI